MKTLNGYTLEEVKENLREAVLELADVRDHRAGVKSLNLGGNLYSCELRVDEKEDAAAAKMQEMRLLYKRLVAGESD